MAESTFQKYRGTPFENYEQYFVPSIGAPVAKETLEAAGLQPGERVLDVGCGTGVAARLAAKAVGESGRVAGVDLNPGMLAVARASTPPGVEIAWYEASAESMPLPDASFDVVLCQMALQFMSDKAGALREMRRVLAPGGRIVLDMPGPVPPAFEFLADSLSRHVSSQGADFVRAIFAIHEPGELRRLLEEAGFGDIRIDSKTLTLDLPPPREFLGQYANATPLAMAVAEADEAQLLAVEREVAARWSELAANGGMRLPVRLNTATARR